MIRNPSKDANIRVLQAIRAGCHSRVEIRKAVKLPWDIVTDCLAIALDQKVLVTRKIADDRYFYERAA